MPRQYYVYLMASRSRTLYVGVTNDLRRRVHEHKTKLIAGFTRKYNITRLVHFEGTSDVRAAFSNCSFASACRIAVLLTRSPSRRTVALASVLNAFAACSKAKSPRR